jgi:uncharacterized protein YggT (Ycf19 family)
MELIDFILNLAGLLLWLSWRSVGFDSTSKPRGISLLGTLKTTGHARLPKWTYPLALLTLLAIRPFIYWQIGTAVNWTPILPLGAIAITFHSDFLAQMFLFSLLSFVVTLAVFFLWLIFLAVVNRRMSNDPLQKLAGFHLGFLDRCPWLFKLLLPFLTGALFWVLFSRTFVSLGLIPPSPTLIEVLEQAAVIGLAAYLVWKYLIVGVLMLHLINSYVYLGEHQFWSFVNATAGHLTSPLRRLPLRMGKMDFSPLVGMALILLAAELTQRGLTNLYQRLPL